MLSDHFNVPPVFGLVSGILFSCGWWLMIDFMPLEFPYWLPIIINTLAMFLINLVNISEVNEEYGNQIKLFVLLTLAMHIGSIMACIVFIFVYAMHYSVLVHNILIAISSMILWARGLERFEYSIRLQ
eukprot:NODE_347_length_10448_cov_0.163687.p9 type:complete len:128 gc:universal NODE_347_length_10448_cov_0.163687:8855-9238(+)